MGRKPCCEKMGMKKGPWTPEEDEILINHIHLHGHPNWRALPKLAGLLRCGKSCRLRWINYLRPDIKRGNFTLQEEETIINLHQILGNRWSSIAAKLPGRTDNEIKNVWHTHLKKRLDKNDKEIVREIHKHSCTNVKEVEVATKRETPTTPQQNSSTNTNVSGITTSDNNNDVSCNNKDCVTSSEDFPVLIDESFWSEIISIECNVSEYVNKNRKIENWEESLDSNEMEVWFDLLTNRRRD